MVHPKRAKLSGKVEVDVTYVGGEEKGGKRRRSTENKSLVVIAVELLEGKKAMGRARMAVVPDASKESLQGFIKENIESGSVIVTDGWSSYTSLPQSGYGHVVIQKDEADDEENLTPHIHLIASLLKRWLLGTHQGAVEETHLQAYLDEYVFRFNRRKVVKRGLLFYHLLENAMLVPPTTYKDLTHHDF